MNSETKAIFSFIPVKNKKHIFCVTLCVQPPEAIFGMGKQKVLYIVS